MASAARFASVVLVAGLLAGCSALQAAKQPTTTAPAATPRVSAAPAPTAKPTAAPSSAKPTQGAPADYGFQFVLLQRGDQLDLVTADDGHVVQSVPAGVFENRWTSLYSAVVADGRTTLRHIGVEDGRTDRTWSLEGQWKVPTIGVAATASGLSDDGSTLILSEAHPSAGISRFAVVRANTTATRVIELAGTYTFDALSADGARLYVIEHGAGGEEYAVRSVTVATGTLDEGVVVAKSPDGETEPMVGTAIEQHAGTNGQVFTLYRGPERPFVHVLFPADRAALCVDLPEAWSSSAAQLAAWGLVVDDPNQRLLVGNSRVGVAGIVNLGDYSVSQSGSFAPSASVSLAKFGGGQVGSSGPNIALDRIHGLLYLTDSDGVLALSSDTLVLKGRLAQGQATLSVGVSPNGNVVYAVRRDGTAVRIDARTGAVISTLGSGGYSRILRIVEPG